MFNRVLLCLKIVAGLLAVVVCYQVVAILIGGNPLPKVDVEVSRTPPEGESPSKTSPTSESKAPRNARASKIAAEVQGHVEEIKKSEIFGELPDPKPMVLYGIAGDTAFIRTPRGQSGGIMVGEELGGVKLLRIGANRVLVEHEGEKKELEIFKGIGGTSLLSNEKE